MKLTGIPVSPGIVIGEVFKHIPYKPEIPDVPTEASAGDMLEKYNGAREKAKGELEALEAVLSKDNAERAGIISAHRAILLDAEIDGEIRGLIEVEHILPDAAVNRVFDGYSQLFSNSFDELTRERASDLQDVKLRLLRCLHGIEGQTISSLERPVIIVADDLYPSDTVSIDRNNVLGIITNKGGTTSHTAIIARSYHMPAVLGTENAMDLLSDGDTIILDAMRGEIIINPSQHELGKYAELSKEAALRINEEKKYMQIDSITKDGMHIEVRLNVGAEYDDEMKIVRFIDGIGLFRTEFLFLNKEYLPTEQQQYEIYKRIAVALGNKPFVIRTIDIGGDKQSKILNIPKEDNPFLGVRGMRFCFKNETLFLTQIKAVLRASVFGDVRIMLPMVGSLDDIRMAKDIIQKAGKELDSQGAAWNKNIKIGVMIEVPSAALTADLLAKEVDFASIGSNDLCQYLTAADRMNPAVKQYYQEFHPALFRTIAQVVHEFNTAKKDISICGELAGNPIAIPLLIGLGLKTFSMSKEAVAAVKRTIISLDRIGTQQLATKVRELKTNRDIYDYIKRYNREDQE